MGSDLVTHYQMTRARIADRVAALDDEGVGRRVPACPDWSVRDVIAHMTGIAVDVAAGRLPGTDTQRWIDGHVEARRHRAPADLVDEWIHSGVETFLEQTGSAQMLLDACLHEHDICHALGVVGERKSDAVQACVPVMSELLRKDLLARQAPGSVQLVSGGRSWVVGEGPVELVLEADSFELLRVFAGRRSVAQMRARPWKKADGSPADVEPWLPFLSHFAYPVDDLVE
jgi:uncharacterized protein (TIGR03083 family)